MLHATRVCAPLFAPAPAWTAANPFPVPLAWAPPGPSRLTMSDGAPRPPPALHSHRLRMRREELMSQPPCPSPPGSPCSAWQYCRACGGLRQTIAKGKQ